MENKEELKKTGINPINDIILEAYEILKKTASRLDGISGLVSGFHSLDKITSGWQKGDLITIASRPSMGKTAFALSMAKNIAVDFRRPLAVFSLEMSNVQLVNHLISNVCEIPSEKIRNGQLAPYEWQQLDIKLKELINAPLFVDDTPFTRLEDFAEKAKWLVLEKNVEIIIIDYIQLLFNEIKYSENRYLELNYITRYLKSLAKELNIPIIILSQLNREVEKRDLNEGKRPKLSDLRDSGTLCDDSDVVCFVHRPEYYKIYEDQSGNSLRGIAEIIIAKQRNGAEGDIRLIFQGEFSRFQNLDKNCYNDITSDNDQINPF